MRTQLVILIALVLLAACKRESSNVARGKDLLLIDDVSGAVKEFKIAAKHDPSDKQAKALLFYTTKLNRGLGPGMLEFGPALRALADEGKREGVDTEGLADLVKFVTKVRQDLYEEGVDTKDAAELADVVETAARYVFENRKADKEIDAAALVLGSEGDDKAIKRLCDRLKAKDVEKVADYLSRIGEPALGCIDEVLRNKEGLGYFPALALSLEIRTRPLAAAMFAENAKLTGFDNGLIGYPVLGGFEREQESFPNDLSRRRSPQGHSFPERDGNKILRALWAGKSEFFLLEGMDAQSGVSVLRLFAAENGRLRPLTLKSATGEVVRLSSDRPVVRFRSVGQRLELVRAHVREGNISKPGARLLAPKVGVRVFVDRMASPGEVTSIDEYGLVHVRLDIPSGSDSEVQVPPELMRLEKVEKANKTMAEVVTLRVDGSDAVIDGPSVIADAAYPKTSNSLGIPEPNK